MWKRRESGWIWILLVVVLVAAATIHFVQGFHFGHAAPAGFKDGCTQPVPITAVASTSEHIRYVALPHDISGQVTKFGGQPSWLDSPQWPVSRQLGTQMTFVGQIALDAKMFPGSHAKMAYIFLSDGDDLPYGTWDPDSGENAVVLQPGGKVAVKTVDKATGPTEPTQIDSPSGDRVEYRDTAYRVVSTPHADAPFETDQQLSSLSSTDQDNYFDSLLVDKIGGTPGFLAGAEFPCSAQRLIVQLGDPPFDINLADGGEAYVFMNANGTIGKFIIQSE